MADYTTILDSQVDPEAPITSELMTALRDNPLSIIEASVTAPKINPRAMDHLLAGPSTATKSFPAGTVTVFTVTGLDDAHVLYGSGVVSVPAGGQVNNRGVIFWEVSSNNGSSWAHSGTIISVTNPNSAGAAFTGANAVSIPMEGFNACRIRLQYIGTSGTTITGTNIVLTAGSYS